MTCETIDPAALLGILWAVDNGGDPHWALREILALIRPGEGIFITPDSDEAKAIRRARDLLVREGDDFWFANTLRALAARLEEAQ